MEYSGSMDTQSDQPGLEGTWACSAVFPFNKDPEKKAYYEEWCMEMCIKAQPNDRCVNDVWLPAGLRFESWTSRLFNLLIVKQ